MTVGLDAVYAVSFEIVYLNMFQRVGRNDGHDVRGGIGNDLSLRSLHETQNKGVLLLRGIM